MFITSKEKVGVVESETGEIIYELCGEGVGGSKQHSVAHVDMKPGSSSILHFHPEIEESYYILKGSGRMVIDNEEQIIEPGQLVTVPVKANHQIFNENETTLEFLVVCAPAWTPEGSVFTELS